MLFLPLVKFGPVVLLEKLERFKSYVGHINYQVDKLTDNMQTTILKRPFSLGDVNRMPNESKLPALLLFYTIKQSIINHEFFRCFIAI